MFALVDCDNFFCSVERVFHAGLSNKPVCVLSSNDGCIVALSQEAKHLGLKRGQPIFQVKDIVDRYNVALFSTNMCLYAAMSKRIVNILRNSFAHVENYSCDESFCSLDGYERTYDIEDYTRSVASKIKLWTDIPVSIGVAPSKTLAKIGSKFAKKHKGYRSVCMIDNDEKRRKALQLFDLGDVWGIGRQTLAKLNYYGVNNPLDFAEKKESWVKARFTRPTFQTWLELNGIPCIDTSEVYQRQTICTSRSFGEMVSDLRSLKSSIATFASSCANKLRGQQSAAGSVTVFICSNRFREDLSQYGNAQTEYFPVPTSDTLEITSHAIKILERIYQAGIQYKKSGVILGAITKDECVQQNLFDKIQNRPQRFQLMKTIDRLNQSYGLKTVHLAIEGEGHQAWHNKSEYKSGNFLTDINEILTIGDCGAQMGNKANQEKRR